MWLCCKGIAHLPLAQALQQHLVPVRMHRQHRHTAEGVRLRWLASSSSKCSTLLPAPLELAAVPQLDCLPPSFAGTAAPSLFTTQVIAVVTAATASIYMVL
jgi:hypothetical protein